MADVTRLPGANAHVWEWQLDAACRGVDSSVFFHPEGERGARRRARVEAARAYCDRCPVLEACRSHALAAREPYGVWGGIGEDERDDLCRGAELPAPAA